MLQPMRAIVLAAGRGSRLRPLTDRLPKPLIEIDGKTLLDHQLDRLERAGCSEVLINISWLAEQMQKHIESYQGGLRLTIQHEPLALETAGGILRALPWLCQHQDRFIAVNADIWHDFDLSCLSAPAGDNRTLLVLSDRLQSDQADFDCVDGKVLCSDSPRYVFTGISSMHRSMFDGFEQGVLPLRDLLIPAVQAGEVNGLIHRGQWCDLGTFDRLKRFLKQ